MKSWFSTTGLVSVDLVEEKTGKEKEKVGQVNSDRTGALVLQIDSFEVGCHAEQNLPFPKLSAARCRLGPRQRWPKQNKHKPKSEAWRRRRGDSNPQPNHFGSSTRPLGCTSYSMLSNISRAVAQYMILKRFALGPSSILCSDRGGYIRGFSFHLGLVEPTENATLEL